MSASPACFHQLEWPAPGARLRGPVLWVRGWLVGRPGHDFHDVRAISHGQVHLGLLGLPRTDLAAHFKSARPWLPAEFVVGVPLPDGAAEIFLEGQDAFGAWHGLQTLAVTITPDGETSSREVGQLVSRPGGSWSLRGTHLPFHGHLEDSRTDLPREVGREKIFGWLVHDTLPIRAVWATTDLRIFQQLEHGITDDALATKVPSLPQARHARFRGATDVPPTLRLPACLRIYAELADGSVHLCLAQRISPAPLPAAKPGLPSVRPVFAPAALPALPSGRPRRLLLCTRNLEHEDSTLRALDIARYLNAGSQWRVRLLTTVDGPLYAAFEAAGVPVQVVNPQSLFSAATRKLAESALAALGRSIWFKHLDALAVFDAECLWAARLGRQAQLPVLVDCSSEGLLESSPAVSASQTLANALVFASKTAAQATAAYFPRVPGVVISPWHSAELPTRPPGEPGPPYLLVAPVRGTAQHGASLLLYAADWLVRHHPEFVARHRLVVAGLRDSIEEQMFVRDVMLNQPALMAIEPVGLDRAAACVCPAFAGHPMRMLLDAAALGLPIVTTVSPALHEVFSPNEVAYLAAGNPLALAHALVDLAANPIAAHRRAAAAQRRVLMDHSPGPQLRQWQAALEHMVAAVR